MSMNLCLEFLDDKGKCVKKVDLIQTPTNDTLEILGYHPPLDINFEARLGRYLEWVKENRPPACDWDLVESERKKIQEALNTYGDDYKPNWYML